MENIDIITQLINTLGFPIVMVGYFIWDKTKVTNKLIKVIDNNNTILNKLLVKLGAEKLTEEMDDEIV